MRLVTRAAFGWGESEADEARPTRGLVIHYDGHAQGLAERTHSACIAYWKQARQFHMGPSRKWADIGYSWGACPHGEVFEGRGLNKVQAAQPGGNDTWYSVTLMLGGDERPTAAQVDAVRQLRRWLMSKGVAGEVRGHRDFIATECPGDPLYRMVRDGTFTRPPTGGGEEDEVGAKELWQHELPVPFGKPGNEEWQAGNILVNTAKWVREIEAKIDAQSATIEAQGAALREMAAALAAKDAEIDVHALVDRIEQAIGQITVRLTVPGQEE